MSRRKAVCGEWIFLRARATGINRSAVALIYSKVFVQAAKLVDGRSPHGFAFSHRLVHGLPQCRRRLGNIAGKGHQTARILEHLAEFKVFLPANIVQWHRGLRNVDQDRKRQNLPVKVVLKGLRLIVAGAKGAAAGAFFIAEVGALAHGSYFSPAAVSVSAVAPE